MTSPPLQLAPFTVSVLCAALLIALDDDRNGEASQVRNVALAVRAARHSAQGWDNAALPDDVAAVGALLQLSGASALKLLREIDES